MMDEVRACARRVLGAPTGELLFLSGATEGIQTAVLSALTALRKRRESGESMTALMAAGVSTTDVAITDPSAVDAVKTEMPQESGGKSLRSDIRYGASLVVQYVKADPLVGSLLIAYQFAHSGLAMSFFLKMQLAFADIVTALAARNASIIPGFITQILMFGTVATLLGVIGTWNPAFCATPTSALA